MNKFMLAIAAAFTVVTAAWAGEYDLKEMTPAVQAALDGRKARFNELKGLKAQGLIGENNRGYAEALAGSPEVREQVAAENADRRTIYQAIVTQNGLDGAQIATVEAVFAGVQRDKAMAGEKYQDAAGNWQTK